MGRRADLLAAHALRWRIARALDWATIDLCELTSSAAVLARVAYEERARIPAYDAVDASQDDLRVCPVCGVRFWEGRHVGPRRVYCRVQCQLRAYYVRHRARILAGQAASRRRRREAA